MGEDMAKAALALAGLLLVGCAAPPPPAPVQLDLHGAKPSAEVDDLAAVLAAGVTEDGRAQPSAVDRLMDRLDRQLRTLAVSGPTATPQLFPTEADRWAYWLNARAAWSLKLAADGNWPRRADPAAMPARTFPLDRREMSLDRIDRLLIDEARRSGDFRLAACAPGATVDFAPMPAKPYAAVGLQARLADAFNQYVLDGRRFVIDVESRQVRIPPMLWACRDLVLLQYRQRYGVPDAALLTALLPHLNRRAGQRLEEAVGYETVLPAARGELAVPRPPIYYPGKIGKVEP